MFEYRQIGSRALLEPVEMPESTRELLMEIMSQNRLILQENCKAMRLISSPIVTVSAAKADRDNA